MYPQLWRCDGVVINRFVGGIDWGMDVASKGFITQTIIAMVKSRVCVSINEIATYLEKQFGYTNRASLKNTLQNLVREGRIVRVDRGVYCDPEQLQKPRRVTEET